MKYKSKIHTPKLDEGVSLEQKIRKAATTGEPCEAISPMIYTNAKDGVLPQHNIRTDRFELALEAIDHYQGTDLAKRDGLNIDKDDDLPQFVETNTEQQ